MKPFSKLLIFIILSCTPPNTSTIKTADRLVDCDLAVWDKNREIEREYSSHGRGTSIVTGVKDEAAIGHVGGSVFTSSDFQGGARGWSGGGGWWWVVVEECTGIFSSLSMLREFEFLSFRVYLWL